MPEHVSSAVIVLAHHMDDQARPDAISSERLAAAIAELVKHPEAILVTSGWAYRDDTDISLADAMAEMAVREHGVDPGRIRRLGQSRDTVGDAVFFAEAISAKKTIVVTSEYHRARADWIFRFVLGSSADLRIIGTGAKPTDAQIAKERESLSAFMRTFDGVAPGDLPAIRQRLNTAHPLYNGEADPRQLRLSELDVTLRPADEGDARRIFAWRNDPDARAASIETREISWEDHKAWYESALADPGRQIMIAEQGGRPIGVVRFDIEGGVATVSIALAPEARGLRLSRPVLAEALKQGDRRMQRYLARVRPENAASVNLFLGCGFRIVEKGDVLLLERSVPTPGDAESQG